MLAWSFPALISTVCDADHCIKQVLTDTSHNPWNSWVPHGSMLQFKNSSSSITVRMYWERWSMANPPPQELKPYLLSSLHPNSYLKFSSLSEFIICSTNIFTLPAKLQANFNMHSLMLNLVGLLGQNKVHYTMYTQKVYWCLQNSYCSLRICVSHSRCWKSVSHPSDIHSVKVTHQREGKQEITTWIKYFFSLFSLYRSTSFPYLPTVIL